MESHARRPMAAPPSRVLAALLDEVPDLQPSFDRLADGLTTRRERD